jgi:hypothetical protein
MDNFEWTGRRLKNSLQEQQLRFKRSIVYYENLLMETFS